MLRNEQPGVLSAPLGAYYVRRWHVFDVTAGVAVAVAAVVAARGLPTFCQERTKGADSFGSGWTFVPW